jgi:hypothetical protein
LIFIFTRAREANPKGARKAKILRHPRYWVRNPPITGPAESPRYTAVMLIPIALPLSPGAKTEVIIARLVPKIMALDIPCTILINIRKVRLFEKMITNVDRVNNVNQPVNTFFLPKISASLPNGIRNIADDKMKLLITQLNPIALIFSSFPIDGRARFTDEPRKGVKKAAKAVTINTAFLSSLSLFFSVF